MLLWHHHISPLTLRLSALSSRFSWEVNKLHEIWFIMSNYELKSKSCAYTWRGVRLFALCECCLRVGGRMWLTGSVIPFVTRWWQYNTRDAEESYERIRLRLLRLSFHHFPHPLPPPSSHPKPALSPSLCMPVGLRLHLLARSPRTQTHTYTRAHTHTVEWVRKHPQKDPHKCEVILTPIRQLNYELQCV